MLQHSLTPISMRSWDLEPAVVPKTVFSTRCTPCRSLPASCSVSHGHEFRARAEGRVRMAAAQVFPTAVSSLHNAGTFKHKRLVLRLSLSLCRRK